MQNRKFLKFKNKKIYINVYEYADNNRLAVMADLEEEPYADITINLANRPLLNNYDYGFINNDTKNCGLEKKLIKEGIIKNVVCIVSYNYGIYDLVHFDIEKLREYDPEGVEKYIRNFETRLRDEIYGTKETSIADEEELEE